MLRRLPLMTLALLALGAGPAAAQGRETGTADLEARAAYTLRYAQDAEAVTGLGDVDGDGHRDAAVVEDDGDVRVVLAGDDPGLRTFRIAGAGVDGEDDVFEQVADAGDVNGDGLADVLVPFGEVDDFGRGEQPDAVVVFGRPRPRDVDLRRPEQRDLTLLAADDVTAVRGAGDVNGDGFGDLVVGGADTDDAFGDGDEDEDDIRFPVDLPIATVVLGGPEPRARRDLDALGDRGFVIRRRITSLTEGSFLTFFVSVAGIGDVDGDGLADVGIGVPFEGLDPSTFEDGDEEEALLRVPGGGFVVYGRRERTPVDLRTAGAATRVRGSGGLLGVTTARAGDVDGDGLADVAFGAPLAPSLAPGQRSADAARGRVEVLLGRRDRPALRTPGDPADRTLRVDGVGDGSAAGLALSAGGDLDGDGLGDLLVGAPGTLESPSADRSDAPGAVHVVFGGAPGRVDLAAPGDRALTLRGSGGERVGASVGGPVDLDADGRPELLAARPERCRVGRLGEGDAAGVELGAPGERQAGRGGGGADALRGSDVGDSVFGFGGVDALDGRGGHDCLLAGDGDDAIRGGALGDAVFGEDGLDRIFGESGCDRLFGGPGDDVIVAGPDRLPPPRVVDAALGRPERPRDRDTVSGGTGADTITGGVDDDDLDGGRGADRVRGDAGRDEVDGGPGPDRLEGGAGDDSLEGDDEEDGFEDDDLDALRPREPDADVLLGGAGDDGLDGGPGRDRVDGGSGRDVLDGGDGADVLLGGSGRDRLFGGAGRDVLRGGAGRDRIEAAGGGADRVDCGPGRDSARVDRTDRVRGCERVVRVRTRRNRPSPDFPVVAEPLALARRLGR